MPFDTSGPQLLLQRALVSYRSCATWLDYKDVCNSQGHLSQHWALTCRQQDWILRRQSQQTPGNNAVYPDIFTYCLTQFPVREDLVLFGMPRDTQTSVRRWQTLLWPTWPAGSQASWIILCAGTQPGMQVSGTWLLSSSLHPWDVSADMPLPTMGSSVLELSVP